EAGSLAKAPKAPPGGAASSTRGPQGTFAAYAKEMEKLSFTQATEEILDLARDTNDLIQKSEPWKLLKQGKTAEAAWVFDHALKCLDAICVALSPFLPTRMQSLWEQLGRKGSVLDVRLDSSGALSLPPVDQVGEPSPLFAKREDVEKTRDSFLTEVKAAGEGNGKPASTKSGGAITYDGFMTTELRVGRIVEAVPVPKAKKLLQLQVDLGELGRRQIVAGIALHYKPEEVVGRKVVIVANLEPAKLMGVESQGMLLAAEAEDGKLSLVDPGPEAKVGVRVK
ncbi:MAG: methionine--tRNA ligase subunit beta, partial [Bdellovibrionota bacterium]